MKEELTILLQIQEKDLAILKIQETQQKEPARINNLQKKHQESIDNLRNTQDEKKKNIVKKETLENDIESIAEKINKCQVQLYQLKNNTDYAAMKKEIAGLQDKKSLMEDEVLEQMEKIDLTKKTIIEKENIITQQEAKLSEEKQKVAAELKKLSAQLQELVKEKNTISENIDAKTLNIYNRTLKNKHGEVVVPLKNNVCGGCHMKLPPNILNEVMRNDHKIVTCDNCNSILYYNE